MTVTAEYPYIRVTIDTRGLQPQAQRAVGNVAVVGDAGGFGTAVANVPVQVGSESEARTLFADTDANGAITNGGADAGPLYHSIRAALVQSPGPSRVYAVPTADGAGGAPDYATAVAALAAVPVQFVCFAEETDAAALDALLDHVESASADGNPRIGVAMADPALAPAAGQTFAQAVEAGYSAIKSGASRMLLVAARVPVAGGRPAVDVAAATMGAIAGQPVEASVLLKQVRGVQVPLQAQFTGTEVQQLAERFVVPLIDPALVPGEGFYLGSSRLYTTDTSRLYVDIVRVLDDIEFRLKAGLVGLIGNVRIDRLGLQALQSRIDGILDPLRTARVIDAYRVDLPLLPVLQAEEAARSPGQVMTLTNARTSRVVEVLLSVTYAGSVHFLDVHLALAA